jgi:parallel beta-helix repeat protein
LRFSNGWESGGLKVVKAKDSVFRGNRAIDNEAWGIWLDWDCVGNRIENNLCINNRAAGIFLEASRGRNVIANNIVVGTRMGSADWGDGIYMHDTSDALIAHNLCVNNSQFGIRVNLRTNRVLNGKEVDSSYNTIVNNIAAGNGRAGLHIPIDRERQVGNRSESNILSPRGDEAVAQASLGPMEEDDRMELFGPMGATLSGAPYLPLPLWQRLGFDRHSQAAEPRYVDVESHDWRPKADCPSLGYPVPSQAEVLTDFEGRERTWPTTYAGPFQSDRSATKSDR